MEKQYDFLVIGAGIIGITIALKLREKFHDRTICIIEKEQAIAQHSSGRNSGVLHAGFYYTADSLKARFTKEGNSQMKAYCRSKSLRINECGKLVIAIDEQELAGLDELKRRGDLNQIKLEWVSPEEAREIDPNAMVYKRALFSPTTASIDPVEICHSLMTDCKHAGVEMCFDTKFLKAERDGIVTNKGKIGARYVINAAGLYADKIAAEYGFGQKYTIIPFKGVYLKYIKNKSDVRTNIYPVPNLKNPFLGVHFTKTVDGTIKIGPTAIPAFWRENYRGFDHFNFSEMARIVAYESLLFAKNAFNFRSLAFEEIKKYNKSVLIDLAKKMVHDIDPDGFTEYLKPGIRAQLLNKETLELVQDFVLEGDERSFHVLNAVSPAFTCAFPFSSFVVDEVQKLIKRREIINVSST